MLFYELKEATTVIKMTTDAQNTEILLILFFLPL